MFVSEDIFVFSKSVVTRFSHDLAGVISAISNSLSLLDELGGADAETLKLASDNADILLGRLRFFRAAFGNEGPLTDIAVTQKIFEDYLKTLENRVVRYECVWQTDQELPIFVFRLILLGGVVSAESLPRGGQITIQARAGDRKIIIEAKGKNAAFDSQIQTVLNGREEALFLPKTMPAVFLKKSLADQGWQFSFSGQDGKTAIILSERQ